MVQDVWYVRHPLMKAVYKMQKKIRGSLWGKAESVFYQYNVAKTFRQIKHKLGSQDESYNKYLHEQLEETLLKKRLWGQIRFDVIPLVDMLGSKYDFREKAILCVGCRNDDEICYFRKRGAGYVVGIDLYEALPDIVAMDMHRLQFQDSSFDVVYSRHSFEHAYDKFQAGAEFVRVLRPGGVIVIEVPGKYKGGGDYNYFNDFEDVLDPFASHIDEFLWKEYSRKEENTDKMDIIRVMFKVKK